MALVADDFMRILLSVVFDRLLCTLFSFSLSNIPFVLLVLSGRKPVYQCENENNVSS